MGKTQRIVKHITKKTEAETKKEAAVAEAAKQEKEKAERTKSRRRNSSKENAFHWAVYGILCLVFLVAAIAAFLIVRVYDNQWSSWQLPVIIIILYFMVVSVGALLFSLKSVRQELRTQSQVMAENTNEKVKTESTDIKSTPQS